MQLASSVKSLGVTLDQHLSLDQHINNVCKACYYHIQSLHHVHLPLPDYVALTVACSIVTSLIDYCNSLHAGMSAANFKKLQRVQNTLTRVLHQLSRHNHITPAPVQLHWLPVRHHVTFKIATITFNLLILPTNLPVSVRSAVHSLQKSPITKPEHAGGKPCPLSFCQTILRTYFRYCLEKSNCQVPKLFLTYC